jgi:hypothetical protein
VLVDVFEGASDSDADLSTTLGRRRRSRRSRFPALGGRALPPARIRSRGACGSPTSRGEEFWFGPASANRDPLPNGTVTSATTARTPVLVMAFDPDTDKIKVTLPDGRTKTFNRARSTRSGSPVQYIVGSTLLDDLSTETALGVDEARTVQGRVSGRRAVGDDVGPVDAARPAVESADRVVAT